MQKEEKDGYLEENVEFLNLSICSWTHMRYKGKLRDQDEVDNLLILICNIQNCYSDSLIKVVCGLEGH